LAVELAGSKPSRRREDAASDGQCAAVVGVDAVDVASPRSEDGLDGARFLLRVGASGRPPKPETGPSAGLAGPVAWLDATPSDARRCRRHRGHRDVTKLKALAREFVRQT